MLSMLRFASLEEAKSWITNHVDDEYATDFRVMFQGQTDRAYKQSFNRGTHGRYDRFVMIADRCAKIGINYGD